MKHLQVALVSATAISSVAVIGAAIYHYPLLAAAVVAGFMLQYIFL